MASVASRGHRIGQRTTSDRRPHHVGFGEVVALKEQRRIHALRERVGGAVGKIEPRLWIDALAVAVEGGGSRTHLYFVERNDFYIVVDQPLLEARDGHDAKATTQNAGGLVSVDRRQDATFIAVDDVLEDLLFRFREKNGEQG